jgi:60 kDa SS-A/Ro ribonucleoprotein
MARVNTKAKDSVVERKIDTTARLAGGYGVFAAKQGAEALLRRSVMGCLLWEDLFYESGADVANNITILIPQVDPEAVSQIAIEARTQAKMRHVPLFIAREMARLDSHKHLVGKLLPKIILRADELAEFLAIYWKSGRQPLSKQVKIGLAEAFNNFNEYQLAKYNRDDAVKLRDVAFLTHVSPVGQNGRGKKAVAIDRKGYKRGEVKRHKDALVTKLINGELETPDTWEVALSSGADKKATWERLISDKKIGALAFVRNLRNMESAGVDPKVIVRGFETLNPGWLLPLNYLAAAKAAPKWERELESMMLRGLGSMPKLTGYTIMVVDVSGSMGSRTSDKSDMSRLHAGAAMAMLASELCERVSIYATAGNDGSRIHKTDLIKPRRGFALIDDIENKAHSLGGGGIFTRQCLEYIKKNERETPDRIIVFSDSQDCDLPNHRIPAPFGKNNYIVDVSAHSRGINYDGIWTAEISGFSEKFLTFIAALEGVAINQEDE